MTFPNEPLRKRGLRWAAPLIIGLALLSGCRSTWVPDDHQLPYEPPGAPMVEEYRLGVGDLIEVAFYDEPGLDRVVKVRPDGRITLPLAEETFVVGLTPAELDVILTEKMSVSLLEPRLSVIVKEFAGQVYYVGGEVTRPGMQPLSGRVSVLQALMLAGGPLSSGKLDNVLVLRNSADGPQGFRVDLDRKTEGGALDPFWVHPYDVVFVPKTMISRMNQFVDEYFRKLLPVVPHVGFNWVTNLSDSNDTVISGGG
jgi:polysaccharide biosynthesis/export protein